MKYVALLRGVNVGGQNITKMADVKRCFEQAGFAKVATCIQSGNVVFESGERSTATLARSIDETLSQAFGFDPHSVVLSHGELKNVLAQVPSAWKRRTDLRRNIGFLRRSVRARQAVRVVDVKPEVDQVSAGKGVLYMSTLLSQLSSSRFPRLVGTPIYREMTIRNYSTCQKILALLG